jgi:hypothetical protein
MGLVQRLQNFIVVPDTLVQASGRLLVDFRQATAIPSRTLSGTFAGAAQVSGCVKRGTLRASTAHTIDAG